MKVEADYRSLPHVLISNFHNDVLLLLDLPEKLQDDHVILT